MPSSFQLELDTTPPAASLDAEILFPGAALVSIASDAFQMKLWGDVDGADPNIQSTEDESSWLMHQPTYLLALLRLDGPNTIYARVRDDLLNPSGVMAVTLEVLGHTPEWFQGPFAFSGLGLGSVIDLEPIDLESDL